MNDFFYKAFEDRYRGSREEIQRRLRVYLPFVLPLTQAYPDVPVIDLGCGRGEWLELLMQYQVPCFGVDRDIGMLSECRRLGLQVEVADALEHLKMQANESALVVSAFHLVEHIDFDALIELVSQSLRVLKPGGLLIMETPNPENMVVATQGFYLDPTHQKPIPPALLTFLPEYAGYESVKILRLQENPAVLGQPALSLNDVLGGASPDYAVVAQRKKNAATLNLLDAVWEKTYGVSSEMLTEKYRHQLVEEKQQMLASFRQLNEQMLDLARQYQATQDETRQALFQAQTALKETQEQVLNIENRYVQELVRIYASRSWRITAPLRWINLQLQRLSEQGFEKRAKAFLKKIILMAYKSARSLLRNHPAWRSRLKRWGGGTSLYQRLQQWCDGQNALSDANPSAAMASKGVEDLTPQARVIYTQLDKAFKERMGSR